MKQIKPLEPPDSVHLKAAEGWLGLGNWFEANEELERISPLMRVHPDVLELRWQIYSKEKRWDACVDIARAMTTLAPSRVSSWLHLSAALKQSEKGGTQAAWEALLPIGEKFSTEPLVPYNLACYAAQLGRLDEAKIWLQKAFAIAEKIGRFDEVRLSALDEPNLAKVLIH